MGQNDDFSFSQEIMRKLIHVNSIIIVLLYQFLGQKAVLYLVTFGLIIALEVEYFRLEWGKTFPLLKALYRQKEKRVLGGHVFGAIAVIIVISVYSKDVACIAILMTIIGDAAAAIFGRAYGKHFIPHLKEKAIEGVLAEFIADVVIGIVYVSIFAGGMTNMFWIIVLVMSTVATITETITHELDDNLLVPIFSGFWGEIIVFSVAYFGIVL